MTSTAVSSLLEPFRGRCAPDLSAASLETLAFPPSFRFGAATAAHQVEGGTSNNNWSQWEGSVRADGGLAFMQANAVAAPPTTGASSMRIWSG